MTIQEKLDKLQTEVSNSKTIQSWGLTFSKKWVARIMEFSFFVLFWCMAIITLSHTLQISDIAVQCATDIGKIMIVEIIVVILGYGLKAIFETKWDEENKLTREENDNSGINQGGE